MIGVRRLECFETFRDLHAREIRDMMRLMPRHLNMISVHIKLASIWLILCKPKFLCWQPLPLTSLSRSKVGVRMHFCRLMLRIFMIVMRMHVGDITDDDFSTLVEMRSALMPSQRFK
eukprot:SAG31_NODE_1179_length_9530_cov_8.153748_12_plen_117_part_00